MIKLLYDNKKPISKEVRMNIDRFIKGFKGIPWLCPYSDLKKEDVINQAKKVLKSFNLKAKVEIRLIKGGNIEEMTFSDNWVKALDKYGDDIVKIITKRKMTQAKELTWTTCKNSCWDIAQKNPWFSYYQSAWAAALTGLEILINQKAGFFEIYKLWQLGVMPMGIDKKSKSFVIYVPFSDVTYADDFNL